MIKITNKTGHSNDTKIALEDGTDITMALGVYEVDITLTVGEVAVAVLKCHPVVIDLETVAVQGVSRKDLFTGKVTYDDPKEVCDRLSNYNQIRKAGFVGRIN